MISLGQPVSGSTPLAGGQETKASLPSAAGCQRAWKWLFASVLINEFIRRGVDANS